MTLPKLMLAPDADGYTYIEGSGAISVFLDGGAPRYRQDLIGYSTTIKVQWSVSGTNYDYLKAFYRTATKNGALPFRIDLIMDHKEVEEYVAHFVPKTLTLSSQSGLTYVVTADLDVQSNYPTAVADQAIIDAGPQ